MQPGGVWAFAQRHVLAPSLSASLMKPGVDLGSEMSSLIDDEYERSAVPLGQSGSGGSSDDDSGGGIDNDNNNNDDDDDDDDIDDDFYNKELGLSRSRASNDALNLSRSRSRSAQRLDKSRDRSRSSSRSIDMRLKHAPVHPSSQATGRVTTRQTPHYLLRFVPVFPCCLCESTSRGVGVSFQPCLQTAGGVLMVSSCRPTHLRSLFLCASHSV